MPSKDKIKRIKQQRKFWKELAKSFLHEDHQHLKIRWVNDVRGRVAQAKDMYGFVEILDKSGQPITMKIDIPDGPKVRARLMGCKIVEPHQRVVRTT